MELRSTISDAGVLYIPSEIRHSFATKHVRLLPDALAAILYPDNASLEDVRESVNILLQDIDLRIRRSKKGSSRQSIEATDLIRPS